MQGKGTGYIWADSASAEAWEEEESLSSLEDEPLTLDCELSDSS